MDRNFGNPPPEANRGKDERLVLFNTPELARAFNSISAETNPRPLAIEYKRNVVAEIKKTGLLNQEILTQYPAIYVGSSTDIEYPLLLGSRKIQMVDPVLADPRAIEMVKSRITNLIGKEPSINGQNMDFDFDFGNGREPVLVQLDPSVYGPAMRIPKPPRFTAPEQIGMIMGFRTYGTDFETEPEAVQNLVKGGYVLMDEGQKSFFPVSDLEREEYMVRGAPKPVIELMQKKYSEKGYKFIPLKFLENSYHYTFLQKQ